MHPDFHPGRDPDHIVLKLSLTLVVVTLSPVTPHHDLKACLDRHDFRENDPLPRQPIN